MEFVRESMRPAGCTTAPVGRSRDRFGRGFNFPVASKSGRVATQCSYAAIVTYDVYLVRRRPGCILLETLKAINADWDPHHDEPSIALLTAELSERSLSVRLEAKSLPSPHCQLLDSPDKRVGRRGGAPHRGCS